MRARQHRVKVRKRNAKIRRYRVILVPESSLARDLVDITIFPYREWFCFTRRGAKHKRRRVDRKMRRRLKRLG